MIRKLLNYAGPDSPFGPEAGGLVAVVLFAAVGVFVGPPLVHIIGWWWRYWS